MVFSRKEYWNGLPFPPPGDLPHPGMDPLSPASAGRFFTAEPPGKPGNYIVASQKPSRYQVISASLEIFLCRKFPLPWAALL